MKRLVLLVLLVVASPAPALDEAALGALLEAERVARKMPGLRAAIGFPDDRIVRAAVGFANPKTGQRLDDTIGEP